VLTGGLLLLLAGAPVACGGGSPDDGSGGQAGGNATDESGGSASDESGGSNSGGETGSSGGSSPTGGAGGASSGGTNSGGGTTGGSPGEGGEGGEYSPPDCEADEERTVPCASGAEGASQAQTCSDGAWQDDGACTCDSSGEKYDAVVEACLENVACDPQASPFGGGTGSEESPFVICSADQLDAVRTEPEAHFVLATSLDLSSVQDFAPIGSDATPFLGVFDGAGRALVGLELSLPDANQVGLFGVVGQSGTPATLRHLVLRDFVIEGRYEVGVLVGELRDDDSLIEMVDVEGGSVVGRIYVGGAVGANSGSVTESSASAQVTATAATEYFGSAAGGLIGINSGRTVVNSTATGQVSGLYLVGGLVGVSSSGEISGCAASGAVSAVSYVGGLIGSNDATVEASCASGSVEGEGYVGGLAGTNLGTIRTSCATGGVTGTADSVGGLVGGAGEDSALFDSYATGDVEGAESVGGVLGRGSPADEITNCYAAGAITGVDLVGGLVGDSEGTLSISSFFPESELDNGWGAPLSSAEFGNEASFAGWDFDDTWMMDSTLGRPVLRWQD